MILKLLTHSFSPSIHLFFSVVHHPKTKYNHLLAICIIIALKFAMIANHKPGLLSWYPAIPKSLTWYALDITITFPKYLIVPFWCGSAAQRLVWSRHGYFGSNTSRQNTKHGSIKRPRRTKNVQLGINMIIMELVFTANQMKKKQLNVWFGLSQFQYWSKLLFLKDVDSSFT